MVNTNDQIQIPQAALEIWKDIPGYEGIYQASTLGRFRSMVQRMRTHVGDILEGSQLPIGYRYIRLTDKQGLKARHSAHRLILHTFNPLQGWESLDVNHKNGHKGDNRLKNLEWCTRSENILHAIHVIKTKVALRGMEVNGAKLNDDKVRSIRKLYKSGLKQTSIAKMFGVSQVIVSKVVNGKIWTHVI